MATRLILLIALWFFVLHGITAVRGEVSFGESTQFASLTQRVETGDLDALQELKTLSPQLSLPYLAKLMLDRSTDPARAERARDVMREISGCEERLRLAIIEHPNDLKEKFNTFRVLSRLGTRAAVKALAFFIMYDETPAFSKGDVSVESGKTAAVASLESMHLQNAPTSIALDEGRASKIAKWQAWWLAHQSEY